MENKYTVELTEKEAERVFYSRLMTNRRMLKYAWFPMLMVLVSLAFSAWSQDRYDDVVSWVILALCIFVMALSFIPALIAIRKCEKQAKKQASELKV